MEKNRNLIAGLTFGIAAGLCVHAGFASPKDYLVIDVSGGTAAAAWPVTYLDTLPDGGWNDAYKTDKIVLARIASDIRAYYIGVFEITQRQWELVTGHRPSYYKNDSCYAMRPVDNVSYDDIRGKNRGAEYPKTRDVDAESFIGLLRAKTKLTTLDIPTIVQWERACRDPMPNSDADDPLAIAKCARIGVNPGFYLEPPAAFPLCGIGNGTAEVGSYAPNGRGIYDMHGNVCEWCLDACDASDEHVEKLGCTWNEFRPFGKLRVLKGGHCECSAEYCRASITYGDVSSFGGSIKGLRIVNN